MRQRNDTIHALYAPSADPPFEVQPGEIIDYPVLVIGLTILPGEDKPVVKPAAKPAVKATADEEPMK
jgi:hypothetical protein